MHSLLVEGIAVCADGLLRGGVYHESARVGEENFSDGPALLAAVYMLLK
jgi:hypothetical protein